MTGFAIRSLTVALALCASPLSKASSAFSTPQACHGCDASGGGFQMTGCASGEFVRIQVDLESGKCVDGIETPSECVAEPCEATIETSWSLSSGTAINYCINRSGPWLCATPPPQAGSSPGSTTRVQPQGCSGSPYLYRMSAAASCGTLTATISATCTECVD
jgi:hypothetical protein